MEQGGGDGQETKSRDNLLELISTELLLLESQDSRRGVSIACGQPQFNSLCLMIS